MVTTRTKIISIAFSILFAQTALAQVSISEIMYNPIGGDTGHEWVEIINQGSTPVDLTQSKFVENNSNHALVSVQGDINLLSGAYAIIADNAETFLSDHVGFSGTVVDSSFSLNNTSGETIAFKMPDGTISDTVTYTSDMGASEDGNSLQKINGTWVPSAPTPGLANSAVTDTSTSSEVPQDTNTPFSGPSSGDSSVVFNTPAYAHITIESGSVESGAPVIFLGEAADSNKKKISSANYSWTFGDGETGFGDTVAHTYHYAGNYIVTLDVSSGGALAVSTRIKVAVSSSLLRVSAHDSSGGAVDIFNDGTKDIDLSSWMVESGYIRFVFPMHTILAAHSSITLAAETTKFRAPLPFVKILYPSGVYYEAPEKVVIPQTAVATTKVVSSANTIKAPTSKPLAKQTVTESYTQAASVSDAFATTTATPLSSVQNQEEGRMWPYYIGAAFFAALALLGLRFTRKNDDGSTLTADDFEIIQDEEPH